ncbi:MAG: phosphoglycerate mutase family protein [Deinococcota bacterium]|nr:phosphoglycerate mutase family protein [Deinococcota bacterium]
MDLYFVRHGETDWQQLEERGVRGWARSFAPLTGMGRLQMEAIARDARLQGADAILTSSYARALESAARLNQLLNKPLYVEYDLHEWLPQKDPLADLDEASAMLAGEELRSARHAPPPEERSWESLEEVRRRALQVFGRYAQFPSLIVMSHAVLIASVTGLRRPIAHAEIVPYKLDLQAPGPPPPGRKLARQ